jgi:trans-aconitate methyltransferase
LCCGAGRALREAAALDHTEGLGRLAITGVDLIATEPAPYGNLKFLTSTLRTWEPTQRYDLITCVHGLHYIGDKLGLITRIAAWLTDDGRFVANFDPDSIRTGDGAPAGRRAVLKALRNSGFAYDSRYRLITRNGHATVRLPFRFAGANPQAGANYTGQPAVNGHYEPAVQ